MTDTTIVFYIGAPNSSFEQFVWSLRKNDVLLSENGVLVRRSKVYRDTIADRLMAQQLGDLTDAGRQELLGKMSIGSDWSRIVLADSNFLDEPSNMLRDGRLYADAGRMTQELRLLFPSNPVEFMVSLRNPISLISETSGKLGSAEFDSAANAADLSQLLWSDVVTEIRDANPDATIKIWRHEDSAMLWPEILRSTTGLPSSVPFIGDLDHCEALLDEGPFTNLRNFLADRPTLRAHEKRRVIAAFLDKFSTTQGIEKITHFARMTPELLDQETDRYLSDFEACKQVGGVIAFE